MPEPGKDWGKDFCEDGYDLPFPALERRLARSRDLISKEVAVKDVDVTRKGSFSRVLVADYETGIVLFPEISDAPQRKSPSSFLSEKPYQVKEAIRATMRLQVLEDNGDVSHATVFSLSPSYALTCKHAGTGRYRAIASGLVQQELFNVAEKQRYHFKQVQELEGLDMKLLKISMSSRHAFDEPQEAKCGSSFGCHLLPCLPSDGIDCVVVSFPEVTRFLQGAQEELIEGKIQCKNSIWDVYEQAMQEELVDLRFKNKTWDEEDIRRVAKRILYRKLVHAFSSHVSGLMAVSLGKLQKLQVGNAGDEFIATTTCSTLRGSLGGPVSPMRLSGYACGIHRGATTNFLLNEAATFDSIEFAEMYFKYVLPDLEGPHDKLWKNWDLQPFFGWLLHHKADGKLLQVGDAEKAWFEAAAGTSRTRKRPRGSSRRQMLEELAESNLINESAANNVNHKLP